VATVYAYEGFNYPTSSTWTGANTTGIGFTGNWTIANSSHASIVGGLNYNSGGNALTTSGNGLQLTDDDTATQTLSQTVGASGSTLWIGFEINPSGDSAFLLVGSTTNGVDFGWIGSDIEGYVHTSGNSYLVPGYAATANTIYFVACEIEYLTSSPVINLWIDPTPNSANGATPTGYTFAGTKTLPSTGGTLTSTTALSLEVTDVTFGIYLRVYCPRPNPNQLQQ
jgi:hypothetical protein